MQDLTPQEQYDAIKMASIIEEEVRTDPDRAIISGIYWKRLTSDWRLEADATLLYEKNNRSITAQDLASDSAYNTRRNKGFPPTPISNPGAASIEAALNPIDTNYWFYLTPPNSNEVIYASTNEEHELNKDKYLR